MAIRTRGNGWQVDVTWCGKRVRHTVTDKRLAGLLEYEILGAMQRGEDPAATIATHSDRPVGTPRTLAELLEVTHLAMWADRKTSGHLYEVARRAIGTIGRNVRVADVTEADVDKLVAAGRKAGRADSTTNRQLSALSVMLRLAHDRGWITRMIKIRKLREAQAQVKWYTEDAQEQVMKICERLGHYDLRDLIVVLADTGMRVFTEALNLTANDLLVTPKGHVLAIIRETKNGEARSVPLTARALGVLETRAQARPEGLLWPTLTKRSVHTQWAEVQKALGWPQDGTHTLHTWRHTCCSRLIQRGAPLVQVKEWMGHKTIQTTMRYAHLAPESLDQLMGLLDGHDERGDHTSPVGTTSETRRGNGGARCS